MSLHLESVTNNDESKIFAWILQSQLQEATDAFATKDKTGAHISSDIVDEFSKEKIGEFVFTIRFNAQKQANEILDVDITLKNPANAKINFANKIKTFDMTEWYDAKAEDGGAFQLETVNRYLADEDIEGKTCEVNLSAFPFKLSVYDDMDSLNKALGFAEEVRVGESDITVSGYSDTFIAPSYVCEKNDDSETFSFIIGRITKLQNCRVKMGDEVCDFIIAQADTAVGNLTTVINPERYDIDGIAEGKFVAMFADIKASFKLTDKYPQPEE